ncbi:MAG: cytochrome c3 family protein [Gemmatimonadales bacterium]
MPALFPRWTNSATRAALVVVACVVIGAPLLLMAWVRTPNATGQFAPVRQPVPFDHRLHVTGFAIDCRYCHASVERSATAGLPPSATCVPCHSTLWMQSRELAPVRASLATGQPLRWNRVTKLPGFVYFNHAIHVNKGVGCETCHGRVDQMARVYQAKPVTMHWCVSCHLAPEQHLRPVAAMTTMGWKADMPQAELGRMLKARYQVRDLTNCSTCHR